MTQKFRKRPLAYASIITLAAIVAGVALLGAYLVAPGYSGGNYEIVDDKPSWEIQEGSIKANAFEGSKPGSEIGRYLQIGFVRINHWY